jgi:CheY-like chemotaxis protein
MKILLIDDDEDDQFLFKEAITKISPQIRCDVAINGEDGLRHLYAADPLPEIVFLDINMPIMDGRETLSVIRSTPRLHSLRVVICSTSQAKPDASWFLSRSDSYVVKPSNFHALVRLLTVQLYDALTLTHEHNERLIAKAC